MKATSGTDASSIAVYMAARSDETTELK